MSKIKVLLLGVVAACALSAVASSSASAAACTTEAGSKTFVLCIEGQLIESGTLTVTSKNVAGTTSTLTSASGLQVTCKKVTDSGNIVAGKPPTFTGVKFVFSECTVGKPAKCKVKEPIETETLEGKILKKEEAEFFPAASGTLFATITFENNGGTCSVAGKDKVTTEAKKTGVGPLCQSKTIETTAATHVLVCEPKNAMLEFAESPAEFNIEDEVSLTSGKTWSIIEGK